MKSLPRTKLSREQRVTGLVFWISFAVYTALTLYLFYQQTAGYEDGRFLSDMPHYILGALGENERDPYPYRLFFWLIGALDAALPVRHAAAAATALLNTLTVLVLRRYTARMLAESTPGLPQKDGRARLSGLPVTAAVFGCLLVSMIILPIPGVYKFPGQFYIGQGSGNLWHNATYLATRPFATLAFFQFSELLSGYERAVDPKKTLLFSLSLFLTTFTKPTFTVVLMPAAAAVLAVRLIVQKGKTLKNTLLLSLAFLPAAADLCRQYLPVFGSGGESGIGVGFGLVWGAHTNSIPLSILLCFAFPLFIFSGEIPRLWRSKSHAKCPGVFAEGRTGGRIPPLGDAKRPGVFPLPPAAGKDVLPAGRPPESGLSAAFRFSFLLLIAALAEGLFLFEKGPRMPDGNFLWGYQHTMFLVFLLSVPVWIRSLRDPGRKRAYHLTAAALLSAHLVSGIFYFVRLLSGAKFY